MTEVATAKPSSKKKEVQVLIFESTIKGDSGFRREIAPNVMSQKTEDVKSFPSVIYLPTISYKWDEEGNQIPIRYVKGIYENEITKLQAKGIQTRTNENGEYIPSGEKIKIPNGILVLKDEGDRGMFSFMRDCAFNENATNRPDGDTSKKFFKVIEPLKDEEQFNDRWIVSNKAIGYVANLVKKEGGKNVYQTTKIDTLLSLFNAYGGDTYSQKLTVLAGMASADPETFLNTITTLDDNVTTLIVHAKELQVINIGANTASFVDDNKVLANYEGKNLSEKTKIKQIAELLKTPEYAAKYQELIAKVDLKEKQVSEN